MLHQTAGAVVRVLEALLNFEAVLSRDGFEHLALFVLVEVLDQSDRIVSLELGDGGGEVVGAELIDDLVANSLVAIGQNFSIEGLAQRVDKGPLLVARKAFEQVRLIGDVKRVDQASQARRIAVRNTVANCVDEGGRQAVKPLRTERLGLSLPTAVGRIIRHGLIPRRPLVGTRVGRCPRAPAHRPRQSPSC